MAVEREREKERKRGRRLLLSWAKAGKDSEERRIATRSEGDDLEETAARALMRHGGEDVVGEVKGVDELGVRVYFGVRERKRTTFITKSGEGERKTFITKSGDSEKT
jgi:hypothetical protein